MLSENTISSNLSRLMAERGTNAHQLAISSRTSYSRISDIMTGRTRNPRIGTLIPLAEQLGVTIDDLVKEQKEEVANS